MAGYSHLVLTGSIKIGTTSGTAVDVSDQVSAIHIMGKRNMITVPASFGTRATSRAGADTYELKLDTFAGDQIASGSTLWQMFWAAMTDWAGSPPGSLYFEANINGAVTSASNPKYSGTFLVSAAGIGGNVDDLSTDSQSFPLIDRPSVRTSVNATTIAVASNGFSLPQGTINVAATAGFAASGQINVVTANGLQVVAYTGTTGTSFTGCTGGTGAMATGGAVTQ